MSRWAGCRRPSRCPCTSSCPCSWLRKNRSNKVTQTASAEILPPPFKTQSRTQTSEYSERANDGTAPFQSLTQPSSPEEASSVLVMFQLTRHTWELWLSNWATICTSNLVGPVDVLSFLLGEAQQLTRRPDTENSAEASFTHACEMFLDFQISSCCSQHWAKHRRAGSGHADDILQRGWPISLQAFLCFPVNSLPVLG